MQKAEIYARMKKIIHDQLDVEESDITESSRFLDDLNADSLALVELVLAFEEGFGVTIPDGQADKLLTVGDALAFVLAHGGTENASRVGAA